MLRRKKQVHVPTGKAVSLSSDGNIIGLIFLSHHLTPIYCSVSHFKFNSFFSSLHVPTLPSETYRYMYSSTPPPLSRSPILLTLLTHPHFNLYQPALFPPPFPSYRIHTYIHIAITFPKRTKKRKPQKKKKA